MTSCTGCRWVNFGGPERPGEDRWQGRGCDASALEKPSVPAWAVNQLSWRDRRAYDKLIQAAERLRAAHAQTLSGKKVDLSTIELQHKAAVKVATDLVRGVLAAAGNPATPATMKAVIDTLQALPGGGRRDSPGPSRHSDSARLVR